MKPKLFKELIESIKEAGAIRRGEKEPARTTVWNIADELKTEDDAIEYFSAALETGDENLIAAALDDVTKAGFRDALSKNSKTWDELKAEWDAEDEKKNIRNWINNHLPVIYGHNPAWVLTHPWELVEDGWREVKWAWQRVFRGWDDRVCWSIDGYLADMIPLWMRRLQKVAHGYPSTLYDDVTGIGTDILAIPAHRDEDPNMQKWINILEEIAVGFEAYRETEENKWTSVWYPAQEERLAKFEKGFDLFRKYFPDLWD